MFPQHRTREAPMSARVCTRPTINTPRPTKGRAHTCAPETTGYAPDPACTRPTLDVRARSEFVLARSKDIRARSSVVRARSQSYAPGPHSYAPALTRTRPLRDVCAPLYKYAPAPQRAPLPRRFGLQLPRGGCLLGTIGKCFTVSFDTYLFFAHPPVILNMDLGGPSEMRDAEKRLKKRLRDAGRVRNHKQKKRLHIFIDDELKAFRGWEDVQSPWTFIQCAKYIAWCHLGRMWPHSRYSQIRRYDKGNLNYCTNEIFKERCIQAYQYIYNKAKVHRNEVNLSILRMVYAEVILGVEVDWRTMEIQPNSKMAAVTTTSLPIERKFPGEALGKKATEVEVPNEEVTWSDTSSDDSDTGCDPSVRKQIEGFFKCQWLNSVFQETTTIGDEIGEEGAALEVDAVASENINENIEPANDDPIGRGVYLELRARYEQSLKKNEDLAEEVRQQKEELQKCHAQLQEKDKQLQEYAKLVFTLKS
jgi:hypothetical protein